MLRTYMRLKFVKWWGCSRGFWEIWPILATHDRTASSLGMIAVIAAHGWIYAKAVAAGIKNPQGRLFLVITNLDCCWGNTSEEETRSHPLHS